MQESDIKKLFFKIFIGVNHMQNLNIIHRDLNLENIIVKFEEDNYN